MQFYLVIGLAIFALSSAFVLPTLSLSRLTLKMSSDVPTSFYDIIERDANGNEVSFEKFRGKVVYGVNVASRCGYTSSGYALLSKLSQLKDQGVEVALFPCNQVRSFRYINEDRSLT